MTTKKPNETVLDSVAEGRREFVKKLFVGAAFAAPLLASFSTEGGIEIDQGSCPGDVSNMELFCANQTQIYLSNQKYFEPPTPAYRADFNLIKGYAIATITMDYETLLVKLNIPRRGFKKAYLSGCDVPKKIPLHQGPNIIEGGCSEYKYSDNTIDPRIIWKAMENECVSVIVSTHDFTDEANFYPVCKPDIYF